MKTEDVEKDIYEAIDLFTGNREVHTPSLVKDIMKIINKELKQERNKAIDECIEVARKRLSDNWYWPQATEDFEKLKV